VTIIIYNITYMIMAPSEYNKNTYIRDDNDTHIHVHTFRRALEAIMAPRDTPTTNSFVSERMCRGG
jgi:hypothetical protein